MKKLLIIMHSMPIGGAERVLIDILNNFDYSSYMVTLLLKNNEGELLPFVNKNVRILSESGPFVRNFYTRFKGRLLRFLNFDDYIEKKHVKNILDNHYDCIISFCQGTAHKLHSYITDYSSNNVSWVHSDLSKGNWGVLLFHNLFHEQEFAYNQMDKIIFVSDGSKMTFNEIFSIKENIKQETLYNIIDKESIIKKSKDEIIQHHRGRTIFVNVGRLVEAKQQIRLLKAVKLLKDIRNDFEVWIVGDGPLRAELSGFIERENLGENVHLLGNKKNPYPYIHAADIFVSTSRQEGYPMVICEALVLHKPVISTNIIGPREILENGKYGFLVDETPYAIQSAMLQMMTNIKLQKEYEKLSEQRSLSFSKESFMNSFYSIING